MEAPLAANMFVVVAKLGVVDEKVAVTVVNGNGVLRKT